MKLREKLSFRNWRISSKLLVVMLLVSLAPLLLAAWMISASSVRALTQQTQDDLARLGNSVALHISTALADSQGLLTMAAKDPQVAAVLAGGAVAGGESDLNTAVSNLLQANGNIDTVGIYDRAGAAMAHTDPATVGRNVAGRDFIRAALDGAAYVSSYRRDLVNDLAGINLSAPVKDGGEVVGAVAIHLDEQLIADVFGQTLGAETADLAAQAREAMNIYLVDPHGIVMSQWRGDDWLQRSLGALTTDMQARIAQAKPLGGVCPDNASQCAPADKIARLPAPMAAVQPLGEAIAQGLQSGRPGSLRYCHPDDPNAPSADRQCGGAFHVAAFAPVANPVASAAQGGQGGPAPAALFSVVVDLPEASFLGSVDRQRLLGYAIAGVMAVLAVIGSLLLARTLARPISTLATTAGEVESDRPFIPDRLSHVTGQGDEVGHLARVFSRMVLALQARMAELRAIYDISRSISASIDLDQTTAYVVEALRNAIPYDAAEISLLDPASGQMALNYAVGQEPFDKAQNARVYPVDQGLIGQLVAQREAFVIDDLARAPLAAAEPARTWRELPPRAYLGAPLLVKGKLIGVIEMVSRQPGALTAGHLRVVESVGSQAAVSIQNAQEVQTREKQLKAQIQELRIEIDEIKRAKQVDEIVDTDYFQRLSAQARRLRAGRGEASAVTGEADQDQTP